MSHCYLNPWLLKPIFQHRLLLNIWPDATQIPSRYLSVLRFTPWRLSGPHTGSGEHSGPQRDSNSDLSVIQSLYKGSNLGDYLEK
jgi:hypothetical protein